MRVKLLTIPMKFAKILLLSLKKCRGFADITYMSYGYLYIFCSIGLAVTTCSQPPQIKHLRGKGIEALSGQNSAVIPIPGNNIASAADDKLGQDPDSFSEMKINVTPATAVKSLGTNFSLVACGMNAAGDRQILENVSWYVTDPSVVALKDGIFVAKSVGATLITAKFHSLSAEYEFRVVSGMTGYDQLICTQWKDAIDTLVSELQNCPPPDSDAVNCREENRGFELAQHLLAECFSRNSTGSCSGIESDFSAASGRLISCYSEIGSNDNCVRKKEKALQDCKMYADSMCEIQRPKACEQLQGN